MPIQNNTGIKITGKTLAQAMENMNLLADVEVLVGFPEATTNRPPDPDNPHGLTNAALGYIHDNGEPGAHIPQRQFMRPGVESVEQKITGNLVNAMRAALDNKGKQTSELWLTAAGQDAQMGIRSFINDGVPPPLADSTLRARLRKHKGRKGEKTELANRARGVLPSVDFAKPLVDTAEMRNAVNYVLRSRKARG